MVIIITREVSELRLSDLLRYLSFRKNAQIINTQDYLSNSGMNLDMSKNDKGLTNCKYMRVIHDTIFSEFPFKIVLQLNNIFF